jgi:molybdopterin-guanine dinucleotide biosynthesis protein A
MVERHCRGVVLAGGANARFGGAPKGLSMIDGRRVVDRVLEALAGAADERFIITNDAVVSEAVAGVAAYGDERAERGSLVGLHSALRHCREAALVVAWDMPFVPTALLAYLRALGERAETAAIPMGLSGPEPLCAYYPRAALAHIEQHLDAGDLRLSHLVATLTTAVLVPPDDLARFGSPDLLFSNVNTEADLVAARERCGAGLQPTFIPLVVHR